MAENNKNTYMLTDTELASVIADAVKEETVKMLDVKGQDFMFGLMVTFVGTAIGANIMGKLNEYKTQGEA